MTLNNRDDLNRGLKWAREQRPQRYLCLTAHLKLVLSFLDFFFNTDPIKSYIKILKCIIIIFFKLVPVQPKGYVNVT